MTNDLDLAWHAGMVRWVSARRRRERVEATPGEQRRDQLLGTLSRGDLPEIVDQVLASEQEREIGARRDRRAYLGGLEHLNLRARVLGSQRLTVACGEEFEALLRAVTEQDAYLQTDPSRYDEQTRPRGVILTRSLGIVSLLATVALLQPLARLGVIPTSAALLTSLGLCVVGELIITPETTPQKAIDNWWGLWALERWRFQQEVERARSRWRRVMADVHVRPLVRELLERALRKPSRLKEVKAPGLRQARDNAYLAHTAPVRQFLRATKQIGDGALGLAGARGSGKSLLIESYLDGRLSNADAAAPVRRLAVQVSAPVQYEPRDFVLHLYATLCRKVIAVTDPAGRDPAQRQWAALLRWEGLRRWVTGTLRDLVTLLLILTPVAGLAGAIVGFDHIFGPNFPQRIPWILAALLAVVLPVAWRRTARSLSVPPFEPIVSGLRALVRWVLAAGTGGRDRVEIAALHRLATRQLAEIRFLQTRTSGWSGKLSLPMRSEAGWTHSTQHAQQPLTHPEIVSQFREFLGTTARVLGGHPEDTPRVLVGIDELDKIESPEQAQAFLNEIKGVFGVPGCQFLVAVSEDALAAFERRGIPIRDAFDSAFDRIIQISQIDYQDTCLLLERRAPDMPEPFMALCHCMSGGLPRDLIRVARAMMDLTADPLDKEPVLDDVCSALVGDELNRKGHAFRVGASRLSNEFDTGVFAWKLSNLPTEPSPERLLELATDLMPGDGVQREITPFAVLQEEAGSFAYYCATLLDVFMKKTEEELLRRGISQPNNPGSFDSLAGVRQRLAVNPQLAWLALDSFRQEWGLPLATRKGNAS